MVAFFEIMTAQGFPTKAALVIANPKSKLLDQLREVLRVKHYSLRTEEAYGQWVRRYLKFHRAHAGSWIHPRDLGPADVVVLLNHLANVENVAAGTQNQALNAINRLRATRCGTPLPRICWRMATTSAPSKICWGTRMFPRRSFTRM